MVAVSTVVAAIAEQIIEQTGIQTFDYVPDDINPPIVFLHVTGMVDETFGATSYRLSMDVVVFTSKAVDSAGQRQLYDFLDPTGRTSMWSAIGADNKFGIPGINGDLGEYRSLGIDEIAAYGYYGGAWPLTVTTL